MKRPYSDQLFAGRAAPLAFAVPKASPDDDMFTTSRPLASRRWHRVQPTGTIVILRDAASAVFGTARHGFQQTAPRCLLSNRDGEQRQTDHIPHVYVTTA